MKIKKLLLVSLTALVVISSVIYVVPATDYVEAVYIDQSTSSKVIFKDVPSDHPDFEIINEMYTLGYISGYSDGTFRPSEKISRKHVAALLSRVIKLEPVRPAKEFKDVSPKNPNYIGIQAIQRAGIMGGDEYGNFKPEAFLTRAQLAKMIDLAFKLEGKGNNNFKDIPSTHWANKHVMAVHSNRIMVGYEEYFKPNDKVTRAQYTEFLYRALNIKNNKQTDLTDPPLAEKIPNQFTDISDATLRTSFDKGVNMMLSMLEQKITDDESEHLITDGQINALTTLLGNRRLAQMAPENILYLKRFVEKDSEFEKILDRWVKGDFSEIKNDLFTLLAQDPENMSSDSWNDPSRFNIRTKEAEEYYVLKIFGEEALKRHKEQYE